MGCRMCSGLRIFAVLSVAWASSALAVGCGGAGKASTPSGSIVPVAEGDFHIGVPTSLKAGQYTFRVHNEGPTHHEFIVVRTTGRALPLRPDGLTVDEEAIEHREAGLLEPGAPGAVRDLTVKLKPGRYVFFCNMEGHYMAGMHTELVVT
jgi:uncharacterized cupredoxin-like copper-binding protein